MKSAYELAMERLAKESPIDSVTDEQKKAIAEIDQKYSSKIAEREVFLKSKIAESISNGEFEEAQRSAPASRSRTHSSPPFSPMLNRFIHGLM